MSINVASSSKLLKPYIKQYWSIENVVPNGEQYVQRIIPSGLSELLIYLSSRPKVIDNTKNLTENLILSGHQKEYYDILIEGNLSVFSVVFQPQGLMQFFNLPLTEIYNQNVPLNFLNKKLGQDLEPKMLEANSFQKKIQLIEVLLIDLLKENQNRFEFQRINHVIELIKKTQGNVNINFLASEACLSRKQFERIFSKFIGVTPKQYLKTIRFQLSLHKKAQNDKLNITELAYESGYYDQAHLINEFKSLTGQTPKQYFDKNISFSDFFT